MNIMVPTMSQSYHRETHADSNGGFSSGLSSSSTSRSMKRPLPAIDVGLGPSTSNHKKSRTVIVIDGIRTIAPPETSIEPDHVPRPQTMDGGKPDENDDDNGYRDDLNDLDSDEDDNDSTTSSQATVPPQPSKDGLDQKICSLKEDQIMEKLDTDIKQLGKQEMLQYVVKRMHKAVDLDHVRSLPSLVKQEGGEYEWKVKNQTCCQLSDINNSKLPDSWNPQKRRRRLRRRSTPSARATTGNGIDGGQPLLRKETKSRVRDMLEISCTKVRQSLPKWITTIEQRENRIKLFTRPQFVKNVIAKTEKEISSEALYNSCLWSVAISENHPDDANSYLLEAFGPSQLLETLRQNTVKFVKHCIHRQNRNALADDNESLLVDVSLSLTESGSLGLALMTGRKLDGSESKIGAWVTGANPETLFCRLLGGPMAYGDGCTLIAVNDINVQSCESAMCLIAGAKKAEELQLQLGSKPKTKITVRVSRYASFQQSVDQSALVIRSMDGRPYDSEKIGTFRLERFLERKGAPPDCWVERDEKGDMPSTLNAPDAGPTSKKESARAYKTVIRDRRSVEIEVVLSTREGGIGANLDEIPDTGLYCRRISDSKQLGKILGKAACQLGAVLWKVNGDVVKSRAEVDAIIDCVGLGCYTLTLLMFDGTDLSSVDRDKLARGKINPRRVDGKPYPLFQSVSGVAMKKSKQNPKIHCENDGSDSDIDNEGMEGRLTSTSSGTGSKSNLQRYLEFERKFKRMVRLDYKDTKIHIKHVFSSLWAKHKALFGEMVPCDDSCQCFCFTADLCENVLGDHVSRQRKNRSLSESVSVLESRVRGIMAHFSPRLVGLLRDEYKDETPNVLVDRLCDMWTFHTRSRQYGVQCSAVCQCREEWDQLFAKGNKDEAEDFWASSTVSKKKPPVVHATTSHANSFIPRKKHRTGNLILASNSAASSSVDVPISRKRAPSLNRSVALQTITFEVAFDSSIRLGGYFLTNKKSNGMTYVEVISIYPGGQLAKDRRIMPGICVQAVTAGENVSFISNHDELKQRFEVARRHRRPFKLIFLKQGSHFIRQPVGQPVEHAWDNNGNWIGTVADGWAGCADDLERTNQPLSSGPALPSDGLATVGNIVDTWIVRVHDNPVPSMSSCTPAKSCIKGTSNNINCKQKTVTFSRSSGKEIIFDKDYPSNTEVVRYSAEASHEHAKKDSMITQEQRLADAIRTGTCKDVVDVLQSGFSLDANLVRTVLRDHCDNLKREKSQVVDDQSLAANAKKRDIESKSMVLKIYINCGYQIQKAMSVTKWYKLEIHVLHIRIENAVENFGKICGGNAFVRHGKDESTKEMLGVIPGKSITEHLSHGTDVLASFTVSNNGDFGLDDREFVIDIDEGFPDELPPKNRIGSVIFELNDLEKKCPSDGNWIEIQPIRRDQSLLPLGEVTISLTKQHVGHEYVCQKRTEILQSLKVQVDSIKKFNCDPNRLPEERLSGNIQWINGLSLLHAVVHLGESGSLVSDMLDLGMDPRSRSQFGTPLHFAQQQLDRAVEKEKNLISKKASSDEVLRQGEKRKHVKTLVEMLQNVDPPSIVEDDDAKGSERQASRRKHSSQFEQKSNVHQGRSIGMETVQEVGTSEDGVTSSNRSDNVASRANRNMMAVNPRRCQPLPLADDSDDGEIIDDETKKKVGRRFQPILPELPSVGWAPFVNARDKRCTKNQRNCRFLKSKSCHFWHDVLLPLQREDMKFVRHDRSERLPSHRVALKEVNQLWTAVFADTTTRRFIYVQDVFQDGYTSRQGIAWFINRADTEKALETTVAMLKEAEDCPSSRTTNLDHRNRRFSNQGS